MGGSEQGVHVSPLSLEGISSYPTLLLLLRSSRRRLDAFQVIWYYSLESRPLRPSAFSISYKTKTYLFEADKARAVRVEHFR